jgi:hypothetical protein
MSSRKERSAAKTAGAINAMKIRLDRSVPNPLAKAVPDHLFMLPGVFAAVAKRNSGKTTVCASLLRDYQDAGVMQRVFLISPNAHSVVNTTLFEGLVEPDDCYTDPSWASFNAVLKKIEQEGAEWAAYQKAKEDWEKLQKYDDPHGIPEELLELAVLHNWFEGPPVYKYGDIVHPSLAIVVDDCMNSALFAPSYHNPVANAAIRNRHIGNIGASLFFMVQSYSSQNGLPRSLRENITCYMLWRMASEERRVQIAKELSSDVDSKLFLKMYDQATPPDDDHAFMTLDFQGPKHRRFRANFDRVLATPPAAELAQ